MLDVSAIISLMIQHNGGDPEKIYHMMKLYAFAHAIAIEENISGDTLDMIDAAAVICELCESASESAVFADMLLLNLGYDRKIIEQVHGLIMSTGSYEEISDIGQQIIAEARFLVNAYEQRLDKETIVETLNNVFRTACGKQYLCNIFSVGNRRKSDNN